MKKLLLFLVFGLLMSFSISAWIVGQHTDAFGDYNGEYYLTERNIVIEVSSEIVNDGNLCIDFWSSEYGYYQADSYEVQIKEMDGTIHTYRNSTPFFYGRTAVEMYEILLRNKNTKVYVYYSFGYGDSFTFEVSNSGLSEGIAQLIELENYSPVYNGITQQFVGKNGNTYLFLASTPNWSLSSYLVEFSILQYSSDGRFATYLLHRESASLFSKTLRCGDKEEVFSNIRNTDIEKLDSLLAYETTTVSIPELSISVEISTDELRSLLRLCSLAEKEAIEAERKAAEEEAREKRRAFKTSSNFTFSIAGEAAVPAIGDESTVSSLANFLVSIGFSKIVSNNWVVGCSLDGSFGQIGKEIGLTAIIGMEFKYLFFGLKIPVRFSIDNSSFFVVFPESFFGGYIPIDGCGILASMAISMPPIKSPRISLSFGFSLKSKKGSFADWYYE